MALLSRIETFLGKLLTSQRGRDAKLLTRLLPSTNSIPASIAVTSPSLGRSNSALCHEHTPMAANLFPDLSWSLDPTTTTNAGAVDSYLLIVEDADAPLPSPVVHGLYYDIPADRTSVGPEDFKVRDETAGGKTRKQRQGMAGIRVKGGFRSGKSWSGLVWSGPKPVLGHGTHRYFFQVVALKEPLHVPGAALLSKETLLRTGVLEGKVLAWGEWIGTYQR